MCYFLNNVSSSKVRILLKDFCVWTLLCLFGVEWKQLMQIGSKQLPVREEGNCKQSLFRYPQRYDPTWSQVEYYLFFSPSYSLAVGLWKAWLCLSALSLTFSNSQFMAVQSWISLWCLRVSLSQGLKGLCTWPVQLRCWVLGPDVQLGKSA